MPTSKRSFSLLALALLAGASTGASASINSFDLFASNYHWQYGGSATPPYAFTFHTRIVSNNPADFTTANVVHTSSTTPLMMLTDYGSEWSYTSPVYTSAAQRNIEFPTGTYAFNISGGTMGWATAYRAYSSNNNFAPYPPVITNLALLTDLDMRVENDVHLNTFTVPTGASGHTFIAVFDESGDIVAEGDAPPNAGAFTLPPNVLMPSRTYTISVYFTCRVHAELAGFAGATADTGWDSITSTTLTTAPVCASSDFNGDGDAGTDQDIEAFFACLGGTCCPTCWAGGSDFNSDGDSGTDQDIEAFFRVLGGGNC